MLSVCNEDEYGVTMNQESGSSGASVLVIDDNWVACEIVREALEEAIRRGPPSRFEVAASAEVPGTLRLVIRDDAPPERRRRALEVLSERARTLGATLTLDHEADGTTMVLELRGQPTGD